MDTEMKRKDAAVQLYDEIVKAGVEEDRMEYDLEDLMLAYDIDVATAQHLYELINR